MLPNYTGSGDRPWLAEATDAERGSCGWRANPSAWQTKFAICRTSRTSTIGGGSALFNWSILYDTGDAFLFRIYLRRPRLGIDPTILGYPTKKIAQSS